jgi:hypothetical protein
MPLFYFDVRENGTFIQDDEGMELRDLEAAEVEAAEAAASIGRDRLPKGSVNSITVEVSNEDRRRVLTATVSLRVHRVEPQPE